MTAKFHWSKIPAIKFQYKPSIQMLRGTEEIEIKQSRSKSPIDNVIVAIFDKSYVVEVCSRFLNNLLLSDISYEEWQSLCKEIWLSFYSDCCGESAANDTSAIDMDTDLLSLPKTTGKAKAK